MRIVWLLAGAIAAVAVLALGLVVNGLTTGQEQEASRESTTFFDDAPLATEEDQSSEAGGNDPGELLVPEASDDKGAQDATEDANQPQIPQVPSPSPVIVEGDDSTSNGASPSSNNDSNSTSVTTPGTPTGLAVTAGLASASLTWTAPADNGGAAVSDYIVETSADDSSWSIFSDGVSSATSAIVSGLSNGVTYYFRVSAKNSAGSSDPTASVTSTMTVSPGNPTSLTLTATSRTTATLTWSAPANNGGAPITDYLLERSTDGLSWSTVNDGVGVGTSQSFTGLTTATTYYFRVAAINSVGTGSFTTISQQWLLVPNVPTSLAITPGSGQADLNWTAPADDGGASITDYVIEQSLDESSWTIFNDGVSASTSATVTDLSNGTTYYFRVSATNSVGTGDPSSSESSDLIIPPGAPTGLTRTYAGGPCTNHSVQLSWNAPLDDGGGSIAAYVIERSNDGDNWTTLTSSESSTSYTDSSPEVSNGGTFAYRVAAANSAGTGTAASLPLKTIPAFCA